MFGRWPAGLLASLAALALIAGGVLDPAPARAQDDPRAFAETGYRIDDDATWDYFVHRGGINTFGYPISRPFRLFGARVQLFQRAALQAHPDGSVRPLNLLGPDLFPYSHINGSTFPAPDPALAMVTPAADRADYAERIQEFIRAEAPDSWQDQPVNFFHTFNQTVSCESAFGAAPCDTDLLPLLDLEIWGAPLSDPTADPHNPNFVYQRFERGIMQYDATCRCTQAILVGDYFKSLISGRNLPADLAADAADSRFLRQYAPGRPGAVARPAELPGTDLTDAFTPEVPPAEAGGA